ncbi:hypothetical protein MA16_Dca015547 [Dendrobium catenatum]|uniref:Uncharacterized protein n=1 Tax=Dendrobium catenatum TaxID=906689 RepID=A0A2I0WKP4_9ASPA|nr:hypothetical protein MA16_Dca015547 [Dendrobium catenatum]
MDVELNYQDSSRMRETESRDRSQTRGNETRGEKPKRQIVIRQNDKSATLSAIPPLSLPFSAYSCELIADHQLQQIAPCWKTDRSSSGKMKNCDLHMEGGEMDRSSSSKMKSCNSQTKGGDGLKLGRENEIVGAKMKARKRDQSLGTIWKLERKIGARNFESSGLTSFFLSRTSRVRARLLRSTQVRAQDHARKSSWSWA